MQVRPWATVGHTRREPRASPDHPAGRSIGSAPFLRWRARSGTWAHIDHQEGLPVTAYDGPTTHHGTGKGTASLLLGIL